MILRKPFAILIKNFRLIHLFLSVLLCYLAYKTYMLNSFFDAYILNPIELVSPDEVAELCTLSIYIVPAFMILGSIIIATLMKFKEKPIFFYITSIIICIITIVVYVFANNTLVSLEIALQDVRIIKLNQDFLKTILILQGFCFIITLVRATGFNIKKFNFNNDLQELEIDERDNEEFEFNIEVDEGKFKRNLNRFKRNARYVAAENKGLLFIVTIAIIGAISYLVYNSIYVVNKVYKMNESIEMDEYMFTPIRSYVTKYDYNLKTVKNRGYVIVEFNLASKYKDDHTIETSLIVLEINAHKFYHNKKLEDKFFDLGNVYNDEKFDTKGDNFLLVYDVPETFLTDEMTIKYHMYDGKTEKTKLKSENLDKNKKVYKNVLGDQINFEESVLGKTKLKIDKIEIAPYFKNSYSFCIEKNCQESYEYVLPTFKNNYKKAIIKLNGFYSKDENLKILYIEDLKEFITKFGVLKYKVDNREKVISTTNLVFPKKTNKKDEIYIEVNEEILKATEIWFEFKIRNKTYEYKLK
jgi:Na+/melibiose symporter and related transporters